MKTFKMYVVTHKKFDYKLINSYKPIQVGKSTTHFNLPYITDDSGNNISEKNSNYCELTAVYWIWKNVNDCKYIGICHYRRYFVYGIFLKLVDEKYICKYLDKKKYDIILPYMYKTESNVFNHFINSTSGRKKDLDNLRKIILKFYPDYINDYDFVMNSKKASYCNMMVSSKIIFDNYCDWLFDILFKLEKITDLTGYSRQEQRLYGFLSEFLLNVWVKHNKLKIKYCGMYYIDNNYFKNCLKKIKLSIFNLFRLNI